MNTSDTIIAHSSEYKLEVLKVIADAFGVSADVLLSDDNTQIKDKELFKKL